MHASAINNARRFFDRYIGTITPEHKVLDVGSMDMHNQAEKVGSVRAIFSPASFIGLDTAEGFNVDMVYDGKVIPYDNETFDVVISTSCFEHNPTFWLTFQEMVRVTKKRGLIYINAPSTGEVHRYPVDCYRFYPDAWKGLADWMGIELMEQYIDESGHWKDNVGIFMK